jgi:8-oxo-dGTP diphosphatase
MRRVDVVAAALVDDAGRVLVAQRPAGKSLAGLWEFPGGKIEPGEAPAAALVRELAEELGITVAEADLQPLSFVAHAYPDFHLLMLLYTCTRWTGEPCGDEGQPIAWHRPAALAALAMPPADVPLLAPLQAFVAGR